MIPFLQEIFKYDFMYFAFIAGTIAACIAACVGYFVVLRNIVFSGHALSHISFAGAAGSNLIHLNPFAGQLILSILAALGIGVSGGNIGKNDTSIGIILAFALGLGVLFLYLHHSYGGQTLGLLFGDILSVTPTQVSKMLWVGLLCLIILALISRPLLFLCIESDLAEAKGVSPVFITTIFLMVVAIAVIEISQIVGVLLVFTLLIAPAAASINWTRKFWSGFFLTIIFSLLITWLGLLLTYTTNIPASFWISTLSLFLYLLSCLRNASN